MFLIDYLQLADSGNTPKQNIRVTLIPMAGNFEYEVEIVSSSTTAPDDNARIKNELVFTPPSTVCSPNLF